MFVAGADGCTAGWVVVRLESGDGPLRFTVRVVPSFATLLDATRGARVVGVDMPLGLLDRAEPGGRECDRLARRLLGSPRASSVFSPPVRRALRARTYGEALRIQRANAGSPGISKQCYSLFDKLRDADAHMTRGRQRRVREVHPELSFRALNRGVAVAAGKKTRTGQDIRRVLLERAGFEGVRQVSRDVVTTGLVTADDVLDALAASWTAVRIARRRALRLPHRPPRDARGLAMEIWC